MPFPKFWSTIKYRYSTQSLKIWYSVSWQALGFSFYTSTPISSCLQENFRSILRAMYVLLQQINITRIKKYLICPVNYNPSLFTNIKLATTACDDFEFIIQLIWSVLVLNRVDFIKWHTIEKLIQHRYKKKTANPSTVPEVFILCSSGLWHQGVR